MGKPDDRAPRITREFDTGKLAALTKQPLPDEDVREAEAPPIAVGRAATINDPMTTALLAEVARRSQTTDFDDDLIKEVLTKIDDGETTHPHTRRRTR